MHMDLKHRSKPFTASMCDNDNATRPPVVNMRPLPDGGVWLGTTELLQLLREPPSDILHDSVPSGHKENVFCLVKHGQEQYVLRPECVKHRVMLDHWRQMSAAQHTKLPNTRSMLLAADAQTSCDFDRWHANG